MQRQNEPQQRKELRKNTLEKWQEIWEKHNRCRPVDKKANTRCASLVHCKYRGTDYFVTQGMSGHRCFGTYLKRIGRQAEEACHYCRERDTPEHTIFWCTRERERAQTNLELEDNIRTKNFLRTAVESRRNFERVTKMIRSIMSQKEREEKKGV